MKRQLVFCSLCICLSLSLVACGASQPADTQPSEEEVVEEATVVEGRYPEIADALDAGDYDGAIAAITEMKTEAMAQQAGDINDYLVTVELTPENFDEFFELYTMQFHNAFGEYYSSGCLLRSLKYDEGLILYGLYDEEFCDAISFECVIGARTDSGTERQMESSIYRLSFFLDTPEGVPGLDEDPSVVYFIGPISRMTGSKITYVRSEFVESVSIEDNGDQYTTEIVTLKNGETFSYQYPTGGYPY